MRLTEMIYTEEEMQELREEIKKLKEKVQQMQENYENLNDSYSEILWENQKLRKELSAVYKAYHTAMFIDYLMKKIIIIGCLWYLLFKITLRNF